MAVAGNVPTTFWSLGDLHDGQEPFLEWIMDVLSTSDAPFVNSVSYGDDESSLTLDYMNRVNVEFQKAAVRGISLLFATGDTGVWGGSSVDGGVLPASVPSFPPSSPYVTAVGATLFSREIIPICQENFFGLPIPCHIVGEVTSSTKVGSRITSGGGFSNVFGTASYQKDVVNSYVQQLNIPSSFYNATGRAYPDISAIGHNYLVILGGQIVPVDGTSASTPVVAGIITLLNDVLLNSGYPPLGFLNPLLYQTLANNGTAFNDIKMGDNSCSEISWICSEYGFPATIGWDAATGVGSPNFNVLLNIVTEN